MERNVDYSCIYNDSDEDCCKCVKKGFISSCNGCDMYENAFGKKMKGESVQMNLVEYIKEKCCDKCKFYNKSFGVCGGEILPIERAIIRNLSGSGSCIDIKDTSEMLKGTK